MLTLHQGRGAFFFQEGLLVQDLLELAAVGGGIVGSLLQKFLELRFQLGSLRSILPTLKPPPGKGMTSAFREPVICWIRVSFEAIMVEMAVRMACWSGASSSVGELWQYFFP